MLSFPVPLLFLRLFDFALFKLGAKTKLRYLCVCFQYLHAAHIQADGYSVGVSHAPTQTLSCPVPPRHLREQKHEHFHSFQVIWIFFFCGTQWAITFTSFMLSTEGKTLHWHQTDQRFSVSSTANST